MVRPTDPTQALIQSSGNYVIHAVGILVLSIFWEKGGQMQCHKQAWNGVGENYNKKLNSAFALKQTAEENFLNIAVQNMLYVHIACFSLLFFTKLDAIFVESMSRGIRSSFQFLSIAIYMGFMFQAEFALRKYRPSYKNGSTADKFVLLDSVWPKKPQMKSEEADQAILGMVCSQSHEGNSMVILWLELLFFLSNIIILTGSIIGAWFDETNVHEPKDSDKILVKDYRKGEKPSIHIFSLQGYEVLPWGDRMKFGDDQVDDNGATKAWKIKDLKPVVEAVNDEAAEPQGEEETAQSAAVNEESAFVEEEVDE